MEEIGGLQVTFHDLEGAKAGKNSLVTISVEVDDGQKIYIGMSLEQAKTFAKMVLVKLKIL